MLVKRICGIVKCGQIFTTFCQYTKKCTYFCTRKLRVKKRNPRVAYV